MSIAWVTTRNSLCLGGIVKRSLAMASLYMGKTIAKAFGLDDATRNRGGQAKHILCMTKRTVPLHRRLTVSAGALWLSGAPRLCWRTLRKSMRRILWLPVSTYLAA